MKILMIVKKTKNISIKDDRVVGGTERVCQLLYQNFPTIVPIEISPEMIAKKRMKPYVDSMIRYHNPDIIISNHDNKSLTYDLLSYNIPHIWFCHTPCIRTIIQLETVTYMKKYVENGGNLFFVSEYQHKHFNALSERIIGEGNIHVRGYINPCFSSADWNYTKIDREYDIVTLGRNSIDKNPFWIHKKSQNTNLTSLVITHNTEHSYAKTNSKWKHPQTTIYDLSHKECLDQLKMGKVFVSTMPEESWGITALEALSHGLPCIFLTKKSNSHASEMIADHPNDFRLLPKDCSITSFVETVEELSRYSDEYRKNMSERTKNKHQKEKWIKSLQEIFNDCYRTNMRKNCRTNLQKFFQ